MYGIRVLLAVVAMFCGIGSVMSAVAGEVKKETFVFAVEDGDTLRMDKYSGITSAGEPRPVLLFAFGGGFKGGDRAASAYVDFFHKLVENGYTVISTDYRTTLASLVPEQIGSAGTFVSLLQEAITTATMDFCRATRFVIDHSEDWNIDPDKIVACGSSAGAVTVLQAEYSLCQPDNPVRKLLPDDFKYAGVISFAGAIASAGQLEWEQAPCPLLLFHGDADRIVPYEKAVFDGVGLWGSYSICQTLDRENLPHVFYSVNQAGHEMAERPMRENLWEILAFLSRLNNENPMRIRHIKEQTKGMEIPAPKYSLEEYIKANL